MAVKIRLMRIGAKKRPFYRVVAVDEHKKRTGGYLELLGTYNPLTQPKEIKLDQPKIDEWIKKGAVLSHGFLRIIGKSPQKPPRKPKKEKPEEAPAPAPTAETPAKEEAPQSEAPTSEESPVAEAETPVEDQSVVEAAPTEAPTAEETPTPEETEVPPVAETPEQTENTEEEVVEEKKS